MFIMTAQAIELPVNLAQSMYTKNKVKLTKLYDKLWRMKKEVGAIPKEDFEWKDFSTTQADKYRAAWGLIIKKDELVANIHRVVEFQKALKKYIRGSQ